MHEEGKSLYKRYGWAICVALAISFPVAIFGAIRAFQSNTTNVADWLPESFEEAKRLAWFIERFGGDEIVVVRWEGCTLDDPRTDRFASELRDSRLPVGEKSEGTAPGDLLFREVLTGADLLDRLTSPPIDLSLEEATRRMQGWLIGPDGQSTCVVGVASRTGIVERHAALHAVYDAAAKCELEDVAVGGPLRDTVAIDEASQRHLGALIVLSIAVSLAIAWLFLRSLRLSASVLVAALWVWCASVSIVYFSGYTMDAMLVMMPGLVFVLTISGAVHLTSYYFEAVDAGCGVDAVDRAVHWGWLPCGFACATTCIGVGSLAASRLMPIWKFGVFSSIGTLLVLVAVLAIWPATIAIWSPHRWIRTARNNAGVTHKDPWWETIHRFTIRYRVVVCLVVIVALPLLAMGVSRIRTSTMLEDLLGPETDLIQSYASIQETIGPLVPVEIVVCFPATVASDSQHFSQRIELVEQLRRRVSKIENLGGATAASTFAPPIPSGGSARDVARRTVFARKLHACREQFVETRYLCEREDGQLWRISARIEALRGLDYGVLLRNIEEEVSRFVAEEIPEKDGVTTKVCGTVPMVTLAQQQLLRDLIRSFLIAFGLIAITMTAMMRSVPAGLVSMVPNVFPAVLVFGLMGWLQIPIDIGAMMSASVAMGIAVDDTVHFLVWFRRGILRGMTRRMAIRFAYQHCANPMVQTTVICAVGTLVFALSSFAPVGRFAYLLTFLLTMAIVGDLVVLPAILATRVGRLFLPMHTKTTS
jgi:predicted RND superfamily exporter protein